MDNGRWPWAGAWLCLLATTSTACVSDAERDHPQHAIRIGTTLPFSGGRAASGVALERALRLAVEVVNSAGGLHGQLLALEVRDSHSDDTRGTEDTLALLNDAPMPFFVGPEEPQIAHRIAGAIKAHRMVNLLPGLTSPAIHDASAVATWFRLSPSPNYLACALAKRMFKDGIRKANAVTDPDDYSQTFATIFGRVFTDMGGTLLPGMQLPATGSSFAEVFATIERFSADATLLVTSPVIAAGFLQEWAVRGKVGKWYLGPTLNNPALLRNVPAGVLDGVLGISPDLGDSAEAFDGYFQRRTGVPPLAGSHYYFDAVALLTLAIAKAVAQGGALPDAVAFATYMRKIASGPGEPVTFDTLDVGLGLALAGRELQYHGAAGDYVLDAKGDSIRNEATIWEIQRDAFQAIGSEMCNDDEVYPGY